MGAAARWHREHRRSSWAATRARSTIEPLVQQVAQRRRSDRSPGRRRARRVDRARRSTSVAQRAPEGVRGRASSVRNDHVVAETTHLEPRPARGQVDRRVRIGVRLIRAPDRGRSATASREGHRRVKPESQPRRLVRRDARRAVAGRATALLGVERACERPLEPGDVGQIGEVPARRERRRGTRGTTRRTRTGTAPPAGSGGCTGRPRSAKKRRSTSRHDHRDTSPRAPRSAW